MADFKGLIEQVARHFLGEPNRARSTKTELRFGSNGSLAVQLEKDAFYDHEAGSGGGVVELTRRFVPDPVQWLRDKWPERFEDAPRHRSNGEDKLGRLVETYHYCDEHGTILFDVLKYDPKDYRQRAPDGTWKVQHIRKVPYRLPELLAGIRDKQLIFVVEGEKDVERLRSLGYYATCNPGGAGKWRTEMSHYLDGARDVVVIADNDPQAVKKNPDGSEDLLWHDDGRPKLPGQDHANDVAKSLKPIVGRVRLLDLGKHWPECPSKGDVSDYFDAGKTDIELLHLVEALSDWTPQRMGQAEIGRIGGEPPADGTGRARGGEPQKVPITDAELAKAFDDKYGGDHSYSFDAEDWRKFDGKRWIGKSEGAIKLAVRNFLTGEIKPQLKKQKDKHRVDSHGTLSAVEHEHRLKRQHPEDQFDADPWMLTTQTSTQDLRERSEHPHTRNDYITKICNAGTASRDCPLWLEHVEFVTNGDKEFAKYLQKLCGYALCGDRREQIFVAIYGEGQNGKSDFIETIKWVMGDYAATVDTDVFLLTRADRPKHELMPLKSARLVVASEIPQNAQWNEARLKAITGGGNIRADAKYKDAVEFKVLALIMIDANEKPNLKSVDLAIRRRTHLIPFSFTIDDEKRDFDHAEKLRKEADGILNWMIEGCRLWQSEGLMRPIIVEAATDEYLESQDTIKQWMDECCDTSVILVKERSAILYENWKRWCETNGVPVGDVTHFSARLKKHGFDYQKSGGFRGFTGIRIKPPPPKEKPPDNQRP